MTGIAPLLEGLSDRLLGIASDTVEPGIRDALAELGQFTGAGRVYVFLLSDDGKSLESAFEWCGDGVPGHDFSTFRGVPVTAFPWSMSQFLRGESVYVRDSAKLPAEAVAEKQACSGLGIGAYVNVPLFFDQRMVGWLGFDASAPEPAWGNVDLDMMRAAGRMLIFTIERIQREKVFRAQQALSRRLAALGAFAAGLGHEINNPLAYVTLNLVLLERRVRELGGDDTVLGLVRDSQSGVARISETVQTLRAFGRARAGQSLPVHVGEALDATLMLLAPQIELRARLRRDGDVDVWVKGGPSELGQVFANILQNAVDSLPQGRASEHEVRISSARRGDEIVFTISDSGPGFAPEILPRVFDPFFTTRAESGGSGLGLALCYGLIANMGGSIEAGNDDALGGARVRISLPVVAAPPRAAGRPRPPRQERRRILVVDDLALMRTAIAASLEDHDIVQAADGREAIAVLEADCAWDLIICDMLMPNGTGRDVYEFISRNCPSLKERFVITSGGTDDPSTLAFLSSLPGRVLDKPISHERLLSIVAELTAG